jgi:putative aldouronate transport system substrate-binding protein
MPLLWAGGATEGKATTGAAPAAAAGTWFDKPVTISMMVPSQPAWPYQKEWYVVKMVKERTNVDLKVIDILDESGAFDDKVTVSVASGDVPDIIFPIGLSIQKRFGDEGVFANVLAYLDKTPNFKKWLDANKNYALKFMSADGKLYQYPAKGIEETNRRIWMYRKDIFDKNGLTPPKTSDELLTVLRKLKQLYPDSYPYAFRNNAENPMQFMLMIAPSWGTDAPSTTTGEFRYDWATKQYVFGPTESAFRDMIAFYHTLYQEKLIPPNCLTMTTTEWQTLMAGGQSFMTVDYIGRIDFFNGPGRKATPGYDLEYMPSVKGGAKGTDKMAASALGWYGFLPFSKSAHLADVVKYCDWWYTAQAGELSSWGEEGKTFTVVNGKRQFIDAPTVEKVRNKYGLSTDGFYILFDYQAHISTFSPELQNAYAKSMPMDLPENLCPAFTPAEQEVINLTGANVMRYTQEQISRFLLGTRSLSEWDQYVKEVQDLGLEKFRAVYTQALARIMGASK